MAGEKILVVEDNLANATLIEDILTINGYEVKIAESGEEAIEVFKSMEPDIVLMDIQLPEMDGIECMQILKKDHKGEKTPMIALTASAMKEDEKRFCAQGFTGYISKPITVRDIAGEIRRFLESAAQKEEN